MKLSKYIESNRKFERNNLWLMYLLALVLVLLWFIPGRSALTTEEERLWERVRKAEDHIYEWRLANGLKPESETDPWKTGLTGIEWSPITTTLGSLSSKRTATDPRWSIVARRWFKELGLTEGEKIAIYSSGSFPGMLINVLSAAEEMNLRIFLVVSLGASTWGGNIPDLPWPGMEKLLREGGFLSTVPSFYTLGGEEETGGGISPEGLAILEKAAEKTDVKIVKPEGLEEMVRLKVDLLKTEKVKLLVNIGGSDSSMGDDEEFLGLSGGLINPSDADNSGNGVIAGALSAGIPVIHFLNLKGLSEKTGVPYDAKPGRNFYKRNSPLYSLAGIALFLLALYRYRRWSRLP